MREIENVRELVNETEENFSQIHWDSSKWARVIGRKMPRIPSLELSLSSTTTGAESGSSSSYSSFH